MVCMYSLFLCIVGGFDFLWVKFENYVCKVGLVVVVKVVFDVDKLEFKVYVDVLFEIYMQY